MGAKFAEQQIEQEIIEWELWNLITLISDKNERKKTQKNNTN